MLTITSDNALFEIQLILTRLYVFNHDFMIFPFVNSKCMLPFPFSHLPSLHKEQQKVDECYFRNGFINIIILNWVDHVCHIC